MDHEQKLVSPASYAAPRETHIRAKITSEKRTSWTVCSSHSLARYQYSPAREVRPVVFGRERGKNFVHQLPLRKPKRPESKINRFSGIEKWYEHNGANKVKCIRCPVICADKPLQNSNYFHSWYLYHVYL